MPRQTPRGRAATPLVLGAVVAGLLLGVVPQFVDNHVASVGATGGYFSDPMLAAEGSPDPGRCVRYGSGEPVTVHRPDPGVQDEESLGAHNELRWGEVLEPGSHACVSDPERADGIGFAGAHVEERESENSFVIGRLTHYDNPVTGRLRFVTLVTQLMLVDPHDGTQDRVGANFEVGLHDARDLVAPEGSVETPGPEQCGFQPGDPAPFGKQDIPDYVADLNAPTSTIDIGDGGDRPYVACADAISVVPDPDNEPFAWGETTATVDVVGWSEVGPDGECLIDLLAEGPLVYTAGRADTELCLIGGLTESRLSVETTLTGGGDGQVGVELARSADPGTPEAALQARTVAVRDGHGSVDFGSLEPGVYELTVSNVPDGYAPAGLSCADQDGRSRLIRGDGTTLVDMDSGRDVTCTLTNARTATLTLATHATTGSHAPMTFLVEGPALTEPLRVVLPEDASDSRSRTVVLPEGSYTVRENVPAGWTRGETTFDGEGSTLSMPTADGDVAQVSLGGGTHNELDVDAEPSAADVQVSASTTAGSIEVGESFVWAVRVANDGPAVAQDVVLTHDLPDTVSAAQVPVDQNCTLIGQEVTCSLGSLAPGEEVLVPIGTVLGAPGVAESLSRVMAGGEDPLISNNVTRGSVVGAIPAAEAQQLAEQQTSRLVLRLIVFGLGAVALAGITLTLAFRRVH